MKPSCHGAPLRKELEKEAFLRAIRESSACHCKVHSNALLVTESLTSRHPRPKIKRLRVTALLDSLSLMTNPQGFISEGCPGAQLEMGSARKVSKTDALGIRCFGGPTQKSRASDAGLRITFDRLLAPSSVNHFSEFEFYSCFLNFE